MRASWIAGLVIGLAALTAAPASAAPPAAGEKAPSWELKDVVNTTPVDARSLKGRVVLVEIFRTWCHYCKDNVPHLNEIYAKYKDRGLVVIGLTDEARGLVDKFVSDLKATHPIVIESTDSKTAYGITGFPTAFLISADGKIVAQGMPNDAMIEEQLKSVRLAPKLPAKLAAQQKLIDERKLGDARAALAKVAESGAGEEKDKAAEAIAWIDESATLDLASAAEAATKGDPLEAAASYRDVCEQYKGMEPAAKADAALKELLADPAKKKEIDAGDALTKLKEKIAEMKPKKALPAVKGFLTAWKGTKAAEKAQAILSDLEKQAN